MLIATKKTFAYGAHTVTLETGEIARQAHGAVMVNMDDTVVLATVVAARDIRAGQDFFPLTVDYVEKTYAAGRMPGVTAADGSPTGTPPYVCAYSRPRSISDNG